MGGRRQRLRWPGVMQSSGASVVGSTLFLLSLLLPLLQIKDLNSGTFGFVQLALDCKTGRNVAIKFIERGDKVSPPAGRSREEESRGLGTVWIR